MSASTGPATGGCLCGRVKFTAQLELAVPGCATYCHCRLCQRANGAGVVAWVSFPEAAVSVSGSFAEYASSEHGRRIFCANCGTQLFFRNAEVMPGLVDITVASFDEPDAPVLKPTVHIFVASRRSWVAALMGAEPPLPEHEGYRPE